jgi:hypothetical protein
MTPARSIKNKAPNAITRNTVTAIRAPRAPKRIFGSLLLGPPLTTARSTKESNTVAAAPTPYNQTGSGDS